MRRFNFRSALIASILATIIMTAFMIYFNVDIMMKIGKMAGMKNAFTLYLFGGVIHLVVGIVFGLIYALIFEPMMKKLPGFLSGAIYSILPFLVAITMMGKFENMVRKVFNHPKKSEMMPYTPVPHQDKPAEVYQSTPTPPESKVKGEKETTPNAEKVKAPQSPEPTTPPKQQNTSLVTAIDTSAYASDMDDSDSSTSESKMPHWLWSFINHLIYGFFLGLIYSPRKRFDEHHHE